MSTNEVVFKDGHKIKLGKYKPVARAKHEYLVKPQPRNGKPNSFAIEGFTLVLSAKLKSTLSRVFPYRSKESSINAEINSVSNLMSSNGGAKYKRIARESNEIAKIPKMKPGFAPTIEHYAELIWRRH